MDKFSLQTRIENLCAAMLTMLTQKTATDKDKTTDTPSHQKHKTTHIPKKSNPMIAHPITKIS
jgi:hypothetical protein